MTVGTPQRRPSQKKHSRALQRTHRGRAWKDRTTWVATTQDAAMPRRGEFWICARAGVAATLSPHSDRARPPRVCPSPLPAPHPGSSSGARTPLNNAALRATPTTAQDARDNKPVTSQKTREWEREEEEVEERREAAAGHRGRQVERWACGRNGGCRGCGPSGAGCGPSGAGRQRRADGSDGASAEKRDKTKRDTKLALQCSKTYVRSFAGFVVGIVRKFCSFCRRN